MIRSNINEITLYDLMADDFSLWMGKNNKFGYNLHIEGYGNDGLEAYEDGLHPCAIDSMAQFCEKFLSYYKKINEAPHEAN